MKNILIFILAILMIGTMTACGASPVSNSVEHDAPETSQPEVSSTVTVDVVDYVAKPSVPNLIGRAPASTTTWSVESEANYIPFTPDGYEGIMADYAQDYTDTNGNTTKKTIGRAHV